MQNENYKEALLHFIVNNNRVIELPKTIFPNSWGIKKITAIYFNEEFNIEQDTYEDNKTPTKWNDYVCRIRSAIGVSVYCEWVRDKNNSMIGVLAFYNAKGEEIKVKHFEKWMELFNEVQK